MSSIIYTHTDEAPMCATYSFLPIIQTFTKSCGVAVETRDISVAGRVLSTFPEYLRDDQRIPDALAELGELAKTPDANIIKLPNISASIPQLVACIAELNAQGYAVPLYPEVPHNDQEKEIKARYAKVLGSSVNPVLREGNSDRRVADAVKNYAKKHPHKMGKWEKTCKSHVSHMTGGDFYASEKSVTMSKNDTVKIQFAPAGGETQVLKENLKLLEGEVCDCSVMKAAELRKFFAAQIEEAKAQDVLLSLHMKATMMKVSDPIIFGHCVEVFYKDVFEKYGAVFKELKVTATSGIGDVYSKIKGHPQEEEIKNAITEQYKSRPKLAMVDSDKGITNLHVPSDIIIDASMPVVVRDSGGMWTPENTLADTKCMIPDRSYAGIYKECLDYCREFGQFDVSTMGNVPNVGLMAQKAEEYGSHDKTFEMASAGVVSVVDSSGAVLMEQQVDKGDIFRCCQTKDVAIQDWVKLAVTRSRLSNTPAVFWLDPNRAHDGQITKKVETYLKNHDTRGLEIQIMSPVKAIRFSMERATKGENTISVTGNVLRDYLTDLFPILELGTSAKMLSIVPLLAGGGMYETGAGGSAPKHVQQLQAENHIRWDSLGEFLALAVSIEEISMKTNNKKGAVLAKALHKANSLFLDAREAQVSRKAGELDNRGSHFFLAMYWAQALSEQDEDPDLQKKFAKVYGDMQSAKDTIVAELNAVQKVPVDLGGYYHPDPVKLEKVMRPCTLWNKILETAAKEVCLGSTSGAGTLGMLGCFCIGGKLNEHEMLRDDMSTDVEMRYTSAE